jgi:hypothetical protein
VDASKDIRRELRNCRRSDPANIEEMGRSVQRCAVWKALRMPIETSRAIAILTARRMILEYPKVRQEQSEKMTAREEASARICRRLNGLRIGERFRVFDCLYPRLKSAGLRDDFKFDSLNL